MIPVNKHLLIQPIKKGIISAEGNEYLVLKNGDFSDLSSWIYQPGDTIIAEQNMVILVMVDGKETFFIKEENVLAKIDGSKKDN